MLLYTYINKHKQFLITYLNMTSQVNSATLQALSLCIPRVFSNIDEKRIRSIFTELNIGIIDRVDLVSKMTEKGEKYNRVFIHFSKWFANENAKTAHSRLQEGKEIKIIYDDPWFWKVSVYRASVSHHVAKTPTAHKKASFQFDTDAPTVKSVVQPVYTENKNKYNANKYVQNHTMHREYKKHERTEMPQRHEKGTTTKTLSECNLQLLPLAPLLPVPASVPEVLATSPVPRSPSNSPPRRRVQTEDVDEPQVKTIILNYGDEIAPVPLKNKPVRAKKLPCKKIKLCIKEEDETETEAEVRL